MGVTMLDNSINIDEISLELRNIIDQQPTPSIGVVYEDDKTNGICRSLTLRTKRSINGPSRALKLSPYNYSEGKLAETDAHKKLADIYYRFDSERLSDLSESVEEDTGLPDKFATYIGSQINQVNDDTFRAVNFDIVNSSEINHDDGTYEKIIQTIGGYDSDLLIPPIPQDVCSIEEILSYVKTAGEINNRLTNPMVMTGYVPPSSVTTAHKLIDIYMKSGIKVFVVDSRGSRKAYRNPFAHLASISINSEEPIYVYGLHLNPRQKRRPYHVINDLLGPTFGIHSFSNLRRPGGGGGGTPTKDSLRLRCIHGYAIPWLGNIISGDFNCPKCDFDEIKESYDDLSYGKLSTKLTSIDIKSSAKELDDFNDIIKEDRMCSYLKKKKYLEEEILIMEKYIKKYSKQQREDTDNKSQSLEGWFADAP